MINAIGISWFNESDYQRARAVMIDPHRLPATFDEWHERVLRQEKELRKAVPGVKLTRVFIDPEKFKQWCKRSGHKPDALGRSQFAAQSAMLRLEAH